MYEQISKSAREASLDIAFAKEIIGLVLEIQFFGKATAFCSYSGHTNELEIIIHSGQSYAIEDRIYNKNIYLDKEYRGSKSEFKKDLVKFINTNKLTKL